MPRVFVAGSIIMDVVATAARFPRIGETVLGDAVHFFPGGKGANQALAAARLGAEAHMIGRVGNDTFGADLRKFLGQNGVGLSHVRTAATHTGIGVITVAEENNAIVLVPGASGLMVPDDVSEILFEKGDILVAQLEIPLATVEAFFRRGREAGATTILNAAPAAALPDGLLERVDILVVNESELEFYAGRKLMLDESMVDIFDAAAAIRTHPSQIVCVTLGEHGFVSLAGQDRVMVPAHKVAIADVTGAGDCFVGATAAKLAQGAPIAEAFRYANAAASICVQHMGAGPSMPRRVEVERLAG